MNIFSVLTLIGGLAMFLFGMNTMGDGLVKVSGGKLDEILGKLTSNRFTGVLLGAGVTAIIQSSSVTTVMVIGFVNSGIMKLTQAVGVIMGANIGTTITSWLLSLTGISGDSFFIQMLKPSSFTPILAIIGVVLLMTAKDNDKKKDISYILLGFAVLMTGMSTMSSAVEPLADNPSFTGILTLFSNPILGVLAGALLTAVIQSSSASIGILQALCLTGAVPYSVAIPVILGQNIGTCVTALISAIGANKNAKRASMIHLYFNLIGTVLFMVIFYSINAFVGFSFLALPASVTGVALFHTLFNVCCCIVLFPFGNQLVALATLTVPDKEKEAEKKQTKNELAVLDERFLEKPAYAVQAARNASVKMAELSGEIVDLSLSLIGKYSTETADQMLSLEKRIDQYQQSLAAYLMKVNNRDLSPEDNRLVVVMLQCILDFERIADHAANISYAMKNMKKQEASFTTGDKNGILAYAGTVDNAVDEMIRAYRNDDLILAQNVEGGSRTVLEMNDEIKQRQIDRLREGACSLEAGLVLEDALTDFERIYVHTASVGRTLLRSNHAAGNPRMIPEGN